VLNGFNCPRKKSIVRSGVSVTTTNDLRRYPRVSSPSGTILAWQTANKRELSRVANLGLGGLYIRTSEPPPPGTFIQLLLDVPTGEVRARAIVQRSKPKEGMGVKFVAMHQEHRARFAQWLKHLSTKASKL
jgi:PilZ domain-containing protein